MRSVARKRRWPGPVRRPPPADRAEPGGRWRSIPRRRLPLWNVLVLLLGACSEQAPSRTRYIEPDVPQLETTSLLEPVETLVFDPAETGRWTLANLESRVAGDLGWVVASDHEDPYLWRSIDLAAADVDLFRLILRAREGWADAEESAQIFWSSSDPPEFDPSRHLQASGVAMGDGGAMRFDFVVADHPQWDGHLRALRVDLGSFPPSGAAVELLRIEGYRFRKLEEKALEGLVRLEGESRPAWVLFPGSGRSIDIEVPEGSALHFGYGRGIALAGLPRDPAPRELRLRVESPPDAAFAPVAGIADHELIRIVLPELAGGWREARIDLGRFAGRSLRLTFEVPGELEGLPTANPLLVSGVEIETPEALAAREQRPDILWIVADTLRADRLSLYGHRRVTSPRIDAWARSTGTTFLQAVASSTWTLPSHVSMLTGLRSASHGVRYPRERLGAGLPYLPEILWREGYATRAVTGGGFVDSGHGFARGFDRFDSWTGAAGGAEEIASQTPKVVRWLDDRPRRPSFLFFHTYETHAPFRTREPHFSQLFPGSGLPRDLEISMRPDPREGLRVAASGLLEAHTGRFLETSGPDRDLVGALYDSGVAEMDEHVGTILEQLEKVGTRRDTIVVFTSDHGESLGEHGLYGHGNLYEDNVRIPLVLSYPRRFPEPRTVSAQARLVDLVPTLLELAGLESISGLDGASLVPLLEGDPGAGPDARISAAWTNRGVAVRSARRDLKLVVGDAIWPELCGAVEIFDLGNDPMELSPLSPTPESSRWLREAAAELAEEAGGLRIHVRTTTESARLAIEGPPLLAWTVKHRGGACPRVSESDAGLVLEIPPESESLLFWNGADPNPLRLVLGSVDGALEVRGSAVPSSGLVLQRLGGRWHEERRPEAAEASVALEWRAAWGGRLPPDASASVGEPAIGEDMRALGYL